MEKKPGAQLSHKGHLRRTPRRTGRVRVNASFFTCPECSSTLTRKGTRKSFIEDIPEIIPRSIQYRIERMFCRKCRKVYEPVIPEALPNVGLSIRTMLIAAFFKIAMRMSLESVTATMKEVQEILYQLSETLGL